jgi:hypothetical protein
MKLRIRGDSIRLRLTRTELERLAATGGVEEQTRFPGGERFGYALRVVAAGRPVGARFLDGVLALEVPRERLDAFLAPEAIEIRAAVRLGAGELALLVEKDFPCPTTRPGEDDSDAFARPGPAPRC